MPSQHFDKISNRFRTFLPVVVDVETGGLDYRKDALLEIACVFIDLIDGQLCQTNTIHQHIIPFTGANIDEEALLINKIDPFHPFRFAVEEKFALSEMFAKINEQLALTACSRAVLVGHNAWFDLTFINAAAKRTKLTSPFHSFTSFDTATLGGLIYGQTVLSKILKQANINYNPNEAHSALYDAKVTAELFCKIINNFPIDN